MKELSIEEKTNDSNYKAYTELINRLEDVKNAIKKQNYGIAMDILCKPYPQFLVITHSELKESEDERIRKQIMGFITYSRVLDETKKIWLAWLEKQGEQILANSAKTCKDEQNPNPCDGCVNRNGCINCENGELREVEQKPAWSEEDDIYIENIIFAVEKQYPIAAKELTSWLKSLKPQSTWKPSNEQMEALKEACDEHWEPDGLDPLYILWEQLKKLREE